MVARIRTGKSMLGALRYNENKVQQGNAVCLTGNLFGFDLNKLTIEGKIKRFAEGLRSNQESMTSVGQMS